jgi:hypothetical protein
MRKLFIALPLLLVVGCAGNPTALDNLATLEQSFTAADTAFLGYIRLPNCNANPQPCSDDAVLAKAKPIEQKAFDGVQNYRKAVLAGVSDSILAQLLAAANAAIAELNSTI